MGNNIWRVVRVVEGAALEMLHCSGCFVRKECPFQGVSEIKNTNWISCSVLKFCPKIDFDRCELAGQNIRRVVRVVEGAALEMLCGETHLGFESLTLRHCQEPENGGFRALFFFLRWDFGWILARLFAVLPSVLGRTVTKHAFRFVRNALKSAFFPF